MINEYESGREVTDSVCPYCNVGLLKYLGRHESTKENVYHCFACMTICYEADEQVVKHKDMGLIN